MKAQDAEDVVARLRARVSNALADKVIGSLGKLEGYAPPETEQDWACVDAAQTIRALCQLLDEPADRQFLSDRIDVLEARQHGGENGAAGDAIDYALGHIANPKAQLGFLDDWRDGRDLDTRWPGYIRWLAVQRAGAARPALHQEGIAP